jgi:hypothetical protein
MLQFEGRRLSCPTTTWMTTRNPRRPFQ